MDSNDAQKNTFLNNSLFISKIWSFQLSRCNETSAAVEYQATCFGWVGGWTRGKTLLPLPWLCYFATAALTLKLLLQTADL